MQLLNQITEVTGNIKSKTDNFRHYLRDSSATRNRMQMQPIVDEISKPRKSEYYIKAEGIYKIFGDNPEKAMQKVKDGVLKQDLLEQHEHVLGVENVDLKVREGEIHVVMGLSGSGKSTIIRHLNRLIEPTAGTIEINGQDILAYDERTLRCFRQTQISMVFQRFGLMPHQTILDNVCYGLKVSNITRGEAVQRAQRWIDRVGLTGFESHFPHQLSGGMQQRVGLARALTTDSPILLMDEAFSALDPLIRCDMQTLLLDLQKELKKTIIFITHDLDESLRLADQMTILKDGRVVQSGDPKDIIMAPADEYVDKFVKDVNRARVLRVCWMMEKAQTTKSKITVAPDDTLEDVLRLMNGDITAVADVIDGEKKVGSISAQTIFTAIKPHQESSAAT